MEQDRIQALLAPLKADKAAWEASFTEEERTAGVEFEQTLRSDPEALQTFMAEIDTTFAASDVNADQVLDREEFKAFVTQMNANGVARGLKNRDTTDEFIDMVFPAFNGFNQGVEGVAKMEILTILNMINIPDSGPQPAEDPEAAQ